MHHLNVAGLPADRVLQDSNEHKNQEISQNFQRRKFEDMQ